MKNIHVLPTDKSSRFFIDNKGEFHFREFFAPDTIQICKNYNIYITSDEEIKEGDWYLTPKNTICKCIKTDSKYVYSLEGGSSTNCKKIILTTDQELIKDGVQAIDDEFLEWFVKNPSCETVEIDRDEREVGNHLGGVVTEYGDYKIIIPQEEPKSYIEYTNTDDFTSMIYNPQEKLKQSVQEYEQQGLEKYSYELKKTRTMKTAVEWLYDNLKSHFEHDGDLLEVVQFSFKQAKEMEKEKAIKFVKHCLDKAKDLDIITAFMNVEEYYETFKQQEK
jgi:hypothetical protein